VNLIFKPYILEKLASKHRVTEEEVRSTLRDPKFQLRRTRAGQKGPGFGIRYEVVAKTSGGRILKVIIEKVYSDFVVVTAFDAPEGDKSRYRKGGK
jgi:hypothetical protein